MGKILIKKRISMAFLGDEYKDAELVFRAIPIADYEGILDELPDADPDTQYLVEKVKNGQATDAEKKDLADISQKNKEANKQSFRKILDFLKKYFHSGRFPDDSGELQDITSDDLDDLDQETATKCFEVLTGQDSDPKV